MNWQESAYVTRAVDYLMALAPRERLLLRLTLAVVLLVIGMFWLWLPTWEQTADISQQRQSLTQTLISDRQTLAFMQQQQVVDPNLELQQELEVLRSQYQQLQQQTRRVSSDLVPPQQMGRLLEQVLQQTSGLKLVALENLPAQPIRIDGLQSDESEGQQALFWKHRLQLRLKATWPGAVDYLETLQQSPQRLFWQQLDYKAGDYPWGELQLEVFTLSTSKEVVGV